MLSGKRQREADDDEAGTRNISKEHQRGWLQRFCKETVPEFTPLGGSRPDAAVVASAAVSLYTAVELLPWDVILPPDVLDTALAALCAPLVIAHSSDLLDQHF